MRRGRRTGQPEAWGDLWMRQRRSRTTVVVLGTLAAAFAAVPVSSSSVVAPVELGPMPRELVLTDTQREQALAQMPPNERDARSREWSSPGVLPVAHAPALARVENSAVGLRPRCSAPADPQSRRASELAASLFAHEGVTVDLEDLHTCATPDGWIVAPKWIEPSAGSTAESDVPSGRAVQYVLSVPVGERIQRLSGPDSPARNEPTAVSPYWLERESSCFAWIRNGSAYLAPCYYIHQLMNDGDGTRDYFALKFRATSGGGRRWDAWLESIRPSSSARQYWYDWAPGGDVTSNCQNVSLGFPVLGVIATMTSTRCERWDMTLWEDPGHFRNKWNCDCWFGIDADREVAFQIAVKMNQGTTPRWTLSAGFTGL